MLAKVGMDTTVLQNLTMEPSDWAICIIYLIVTLGVAVYSRLGQKDLSDYFLAGHKMHWIIAALSMSAAGFSTVSFVAGPGEGYANGLLYWSSVIVYIALLPLAIMLFLKTFFRSEKTFTVYEFLEERFDVKVRILSSSISMLARSFSCGVVLYGAAQLLEAVAGWNPVWTCILLGSFVVIYSAIGGMRGVMLNDMIQAVTFYIIICMMFWYILKVARANPLEIWNYAVENGRGLEKILKADFYSFDLRERLTLWTMLAMALFSNCVLLSSDQVQIQQLLSTGGYNKAVKALWTRYIITMPLGLILAFSGLGMFYYYSHNPQALPEGGKLDANHVMGYFVGTEMPSPLPGLVIAGLLAALMSTLAAAYTSCSTMLVKDFIERAGFMPKTYSKQLLISKFGIVIFGVLAILLAIFMQKAGKGVTDNLIEALTVWGTLWFTLLIAYIFGTQTKWMKARAIWYAMLIGIVLNVASTWFFYYRSAPAERISFIWVGWPGFILTCIIAVILNIIFEGKSSKKALPVISKEKVYEN